MPAYIAKFVEALVQAFPTPVAFADMLATQLDWDLERMAAPGALDERVRAIVYKAHRKKGGANALLNAARTEIPDDPELQAIEALLPPPAPLTPVDDFEVCYIQGQPFIDRRQLRKAVKRLASQNGPRLLVIDGPQLSGKSYSLYYLHHVAEQRGFEVVEIDLKTSYPGQTITTDLVACDIAMLMGLASPPETAEEQAPRRTRLFCNWLTGKLRARPDMWWIVIDGCNDALPPDVLDLFQEMAQRIVRGWSNVRLVLVHDVEGVVPLLCAPTAERESISAIDHVQITEFLMEFRQQLNLPDDDAEVGRLLTEIMKRVDSKSPERMRMIGAATSEQCRIMMGE